MKRSWLLIFIIRESFSMVLISWHMHQIYQIIVGITQRAEQSAGGLGFPCIWRQNWPAWLAERKSF